MKERLTNNLGLKILAVFLAFFLWLIVSNVSNPIKQDSRDVTVDIINGDILKNNNLTYEVIGKSTVTVNYEVHTLDAYKISAGDFRAYADMSELYDVTGAIPVRIDIVNNKKLINGTPAAKPGVIQIKTEEIQRKPFELQVRTLGTPADGYALGGITVSPEAIYATGAVSAIGKINSIGVEINTDGVNSDYAGVATPVFYDANGNRLEDLNKDVTLNTTEIKYQVSVLKVKNLGLDFQVRGNVADGYRFTGVESDIKSVSVEGMKSVLASLSTLTIPGEYLNLDGAAKDVVVVVDLSELLPEHVTIAGEDNSIATVTLKVEALEIRGFKINMDDVKLIGASDDFEYTFNTRAVQVDIEGLSEDLDAINLDDLMPSVDVSNLTPGGHKGVMKLTLGKGFEVVNSEGFDITVKESAEPEESVSAQDAPNSSNESEKEPSKESEKESAKEPAKETLKETSKASG